MVRACEEGCYRYNISIENNGTTLPINLHKDATVKQSAEYNWSTRNANTLEGKQNRDFTYVASRVLEVVRGLDKITYAHPEVGGLL